MLQTSLKQLQDHNAEREGVQTLMNRLGYDAVDYRPFPMRVVLDEMGLGQAIWAMGVTPLGRDVFLQIGLLLIKDAVKMIPSDLYPGGKDLLGEFLPEYPRRYDSNGDGLPCTPIPDRSQMWRIHRALVRIRRELRRLVWGDISRPSYLSALLATDAACCLFPAVLSNSPAANARRLQMAVKHYCAAMCVAEAYRIGVEFIAKMPDDEPSGADKKFDSMVYSSYAKALNSILPQFWEAFASEAVAVAYDTSNGYTQKVIEDLSDRLGLVFLCCPSPVPLFDYKGKGFGLQLDNAPVQEDGNATKTKSLDRN